MIRIVEKNAPTNETIECDSYTPFRVELGAHTKGLEPTYYWRATGKNYLFDLGVHSRTGELISINLILIPYDWVSTVKLATFELEVVKGLPICDRKQWLERIGTKEFGIDERLFTIDTELEFKIRIEDNICQVQLNGQKPVRLYTNNRVSVGVNRNDEICFVELSNLSQIEIENIVLACGLLQ